MGEPGGLPSMGSPSRTRLKRLSIADSTVLSSASSGNNDPRTPMAICTELRRKDPTVEYSISGMES